MIQLIRGFRDILPGEVELWQKIEREARELLERFGFREIRIPILEKTELFGAASARRPTSSKRRCTPSPTAAARR
jgi:histidyl-tRNA synthetase (EC 6.1.1.21)